MLFAELITQESQPSLDWLGPAVTGAAGVLIALIGTISLFWRRRQDRDQSQSDRTVDAENAAQPRVVDEWQEVRNARAEATTYYNLYRVYENLYHVAIAALRNLTRRVRTDHREGEDFEFGDDVAVALAMEPPEAEKK